MIKSNLKRSIVHYKMSQEYTTYIVIFHNKQCAMVYDSVNSICKMITPLYDMGAFKTLVKDMKIKRHPVFSDVEEYFQTAFFVY